MNSEKRNNRIVAGIAAVLVTGGALMLYAAFGGAAGEQGKATVTSNPISAHQNVDDVIAQVADNGKTYSYYWAPEHIEEEIELYRQGVLRSIEQQRGELSQMDASARAWQEQAIREQEAGLDEQLADLRQEYEKGYELGAETSVLCAQEIANIGGSVLEEKYGMNLSDIVLQLDCVEDRQLQKLVWNVTVQPASPGQESAYVILDAATGESLSTQYFPASDLPQEERNSASSNAS